MREGIDFKSGISGYDQWRAENYYSFYYKDGIVRDERITLGRHLDFLRAHGSFEHALDYGCGPTLHNAIACAPYVARLDMADRLPDNLDSVRRWAAGEPGANRWHHFTRYILECETGGNADWAEIVRREARTRSVIERLLTTDACQPFPLGRGGSGRYDLLVSGYCLDCISGERGVWRRAMRNVLSLLRPGGALLLDSLWRCSAYQVKDRWFPGANLDVDDLYQCLKDNGFAPSSIDVEAFEYPDQSECGYPGILIVSGRKRAVLRRSLARAAAGPGRALAGNVHAYARGDDYGGADPGSLSGSP